VRHAEDRCSRSEVRSSACLNLRDVTVRSASVCARPCGHPGSSGGSSAPPTPRRRPIPDPRSACTSSGGVARSIAQEILHDRQDDVVVAVEVAGSSGRWLQTMPNALELLDPFRSTPWPRTSPRATSAALSVLPRSPRPRSRRPHRVAGRRLLERGDSSSGPASCLSRRSLITLSGRYSSRCIAGSTSTGRRPRRRTSGIRNGSARARSVLGLQEPDLRDRDVGDSS